MKVLAHPGAESEPNDLPPKERVAMQHAFEKLETLRDRLPYPH